jgi:hypothetical protein
VVAVRYVSGPRTWFRGYRGGVFARRFGYGLGLPGLYGGGVYGGGVYGGGVYPVGGVGGVYYGGRFGPRMGGG